jgi:hypothetical protein
MVGGRVSTSRGQETEQALAVSRCLAVITRRVWMLLFGRGAVEMQRRSCHMGGRTSVHALHVPLSRCS